MVEPNDTLTRTLATGPTAVGLATRLAGARLRSEGVDISPLLRRAGLSGVAFEHGERVSVRSQVEFLELAAQEVGDECLGLNLAADFDLREMGMFYYVASSAHVLDEAFRRLARYGRLGNEAVVLRARKDTAFCIELTYSGVARHPDRHQIEFFALALIRLCRQLVGRRISPVQVSFVHHRSGDLRRLRDLLGGDVRFDAYADEVRFDPAVSEQLSMTGDPFLSRLMVEACEQATAATRTNVSLFRTVVENAIAPLLPHAQATATNIAKTLGMSERTFARRLAAEKLSFGTIREDMRRELAVRYLKEQDLQISQVAWLLGFRQPSAFSHAYHRWTGKTPSQYRSGSSQPNSTPISI